MPKNTVYNYLPTMYTAECETRDLVLSLESYSKLLTGCVQASPSAEAHWAPPILEEGYSACSVFHGTQRLNYLISDTTEKGASQLSFPTSWAGFTLKTMA